MDLGPRSLLKICDLVILSSLIWQFAQRGFIFCINFDFLKSVVFVYYLNYGGVWYPL